ncbi:unnamed protein product [Amoebophrya sp. A120]|nr:unnamed protein product [Amoebophrya sp. A120]|eukprot:GSA120T00020615001.1
MTAATPQLRPPGVCVAVGIWFLLVYFSRNNLQSEQSQQGERTGVACNRYRLFQHAEAPSPPAVIIQPPPAGGVPHETSPDTTTNQAAAAETRNTNKAVEQLPTYSSSTTRPMEVVRSTDEQDHKRTRPAGGVVQQPEGSSSPASTAASTSPTPGRVRHVVFYSAKMFTPGQDGVRQVIDRNAIFVWRWLSQVYSPSLQVIDFSNRTDVVADVGDKVPTIPKMYRVAMATFPTAETFTYVNSDILPSTWFVKTADFLADTYRNSGTEFLAVGIRRNLKWQKEWDFAQMNDGTTGTTIGNNANSKNDIIKAPPHVIASPTAAELAARANSTLKECGVDLTTALRSWKCAPNGGVLAQDYFVASRNIWDWNRIPEFQIGRVGYDNWLVDRAFHAHPKVALIDIAPSCPMIHQNGRFGGSEGWHGHNKKDLLVNYKLAARHAKANHEPGHYFAHGSTGLARKRTCIDEVTESVIFCKKKKQ